MSEKENLKDAIWFLWTLPEQHENYNADYICRICEKAIKDAIVWTETLNESVYCGGCAGKLRK